MKVLKNIFYFFIFWVLLQVPTVLIAWHIDGNQNAFINSLPSITAIISFIVIPLIYLHFYHKLEKKEVKLNKNAILLIIVAVIAIAIMNKLTIPFMKTSGNDNVDALKILARTNPLLMIIYASIIGPIVEELLFRGLFMNMFFVNNPWISWIASSVLFGALHMSNDPVYLLSKILLGMVLGFVYMKTKNIKANIIVHIINNISSFF